MIKKDDIYQVAVCTINAKGFPIVDEFYSKFYSTKTSAQNYFDSLIDKYFPLLEDETDYNNNYIDECKKNGMFASNGLLHNKYGYAEILLYMKKVEIEK